MVPEILTGFFAAEWGAELWCASPGRATSDIPSASVNRTTTILEAMRTSRSSARVYALRPLAELLPCRVEKGARRPQRQFFAFPRAEPAQVALHDERLPSHDHCECGDKPTPARRTK